MTTKVYLGVGSNLNRENALRFAVAKIGPLFKNFEKSSVWVSHAVRAGEPDYYNMVFLVIQKLVLMIYMPVCRKLSSLQVLS